MSFSMMLYDRTGCRIIDPPGLEDLCIMIGAEEVYDLLNESGCPWEILGEVDPLTGSPLAIRPHLTDEAMQRIADKIKENGVNVEFWLKFLQDFRENEGWFVTWS